MDVLSQDLRLIITLLIDRYIFILSGMSFNTALFAFCHVFRLSLNYKIAQNNFDAIFLRSSAEKNMF